VDRVKVLTVLDDVLTEVVATVAEAGTEMVGRGIFVDCVDLRCICFWLSGNSSCSNFEWIFVDCLAECRYF